MQINNLALNLTGKKLLGRACRIKKLVGHLPRSFGKHRSGQAF
jgi:hypothetical protein